MDPSKSHKKNRTNKKSNKNINKKENNNEVNIQNEEKLVTPNRKITKGDIKTLKLEIDKNNSKNKIEKLDLKFNTLIKNKVSNKRIFKINGKDKMIKNISTGDNMNRNLLIKNKNKKGDILLNNNLNKNTGNKVNDKEKEEKLLDFKELKSSIITDYNSNVNNYQNTHQDNNSSTSYQTLQKLLNKVQPKHSTKNNLPKIYNNSELYQTSNNFKSKNNNNATFTPINENNRTKHTTKTDFYPLKNNKNKLENQEFLNIDSKEINLNTNHDDNNFNFSNDNFYPNKNCLSEENDNEANKKIIISLHKNVNKRSYLTSKIFKSQNDKKYGKYLINNPNNPYWTSWQNSFLKNGYHLGLNYNTIHFGVPSLRIKQLHKKILLPPVYKVKYNQYSENHNELKINEDIVTYYNKDRTIKSLNVYLNLKKKSEEEMFKEYRKQIMKEFNIKEKGEEEEEEDEEEEEEDDEDEEEEEDDDDDDDEESEHNNKGENDDNEESEEDEDDDEDED